uniref:Queuosine 5'-phosphate N-glycosylase/hydrolase n=1 Tax=Fusarium oxysporum (strain Fo5176) TaxID=660025 RepID=A0A0D2XUT2_FUSOF
MSDDEVDTELLELLRQHLQGNIDIQEEPETGVLESAEYVYDSCIDVAVDMRASKKAAESIYEQMQQKSYSTATWSEHELHPKAKDETTVNFIFTMDLLNFSFWSELPDDERFAIEYRGKRWTGYWSLVAALQRAIDEDCLREAGQVLFKHYDGSVAELIYAADGSAARLVNLLAQDFNCFRDEHRFEDGKMIRLMKRAQILVADLWACFNGASYGEFRDIDKITMFADYRIPQILMTMGALYCSPTVAAAIKDKKMIESGCSWELQIRACSIWCVELIRREILRQHPDAHVNAILIDFFLYDSMKELEAAGKEPIPHHRTRSIWY